MTAAALLLAMAALAGPACSRRRARLLAWLPRNRRAFTMTPLALCGCATAAWLVPWTANVGIGLLVVTLLVRRHRDVRRRARIEETTALRGALDVLVAELRVGAHPVAAIDTAAGESEGRVGDALRSVAALGVLGADVAAGLRAEAQRSNAPSHWERLAACWLLAQTHGLAIATLMHAAQRDIVERERFQGRVVAGLAGARTTAAILAGLPLLGVGLGQAIGADPVSYLVSDGSGGWLFIVGVGFICCGLLWSDSITSKVLV